MLIITRGKDQAVFIGRAMVMVIDVLRDGRVKLGIDADPDTIIVRAELVAEQMEISKNLPHREIFARMIESNYEWVRSFPPNEQSV